MDDYKFRILLSLIRSVAFKAQCYEVLGIIESLTREPNATARIEYSIDKPEYEPHNIRMERKGGRVYCHCDIKKGHGHCEAPEKIFVDGIDETKCLYGQHRVEG